MKKSKLELPLLPGEKWWGGLTVDGFQMPYEPGFSRDLNSLHGNQGMPLLLSSKGRYVWSDEPFSFSLTAGALLVTADGIGKFEHGEVSDSLSGVYKHVSAKHFPFATQTPDQLFFTAPQYNLWIEQLYAPTQEKVLVYATKALEHGFPPGVLMIDTMWAETYGTFAFHSGRFPNPKGMVDELHDLGFKVMLWVVPFITADSLTFRHLRAKDLLIKTGSGEPALGQWWDGYSASLDLFNPEAVAWLHDQLEQLVERYSVDGFKFDGGQPDFYVNLGLDEAHAYNMAWNQVGLRYPLAEYKDSWRSAGLPVAQRIRDRFHTWDEQHGLRSLIPLGLAQSLLGYAYVCPDLIGGGEYNAFPPAEENERFLVAKAGDAPTFDPELFVRSAQCSALFPMMQFSAAPWRLLEGVPLQYCLAAANLHVELGTYILEVAQHTSKTGEPMMRHLAYSYPERGFEHVKDQFMLGDDILVAPVLDKGARQRAVVFPPGAWRGDDGSRVEGPLTLDVAAPLSRLPWYRKVG